MATGPIDIFSAYTVLLMQVEWRQAIERVGEWNNDIDNLVDQLCINDFFSELYNVVVSFDECLIHYELVWHTPISDSVINCYKLTPYGFCVFKEYIDSLFLKNLSYVNLDTLDYSDCRYIKPWFINSAIIIKMRFNWMHMKYSYHIYFIMLHAIDFS